MKTSSPVIWLLFARRGWIGIAAICLLLQIIATPVRYRELASPPHHIEMVLHPLGLPVYFYTFYNLILDSAFVLGFFAGAMLLFWHRSHEWFPLLVAFTLLTFGSNSPIIFTFAEVYPTWGPLVALIDTLGWTSLSFFFALFPNGRFVPRWTLWLSLLYALNEPFWWLPDDSPFHAVNWPLSLFLPLQFGPLVLYLGAQIYRYRCISDQIQRQQTKWAVFGIAVAIGTMPFLTMGITVERTPATLFGVFAVPALRLLWLLIPLTLYIAIMRYRLWDIDVIINRTVVYSSLTTCIVGLYTLTVGTFGTLLQAQGNFLISLLAAGLVAVLFHPLRERLQRGANRLFYGQRDEPYRVISQLGRRLGATLAPERVLATIVETTAHALKLPYAAITLPHEGSWRVATSTGTPTQDLVRLPLRYQAEHVGELLLAPRSPGEAFSPADWRLLEDLAQQAGTAVYAVHLTIDLQHSRTQLVTAREEERRRLRRDLHDGLGSVLASFNLRIGAIRALLGRDVGAAETLLLEQQHAIHAAMADIRRLVYELRPASLDELGLIGALREQATHSTMLTGALADPECVPGLQVTIEAPENLPALPAALEVATYRIIQEALANVVRHACARTCQIRLILTEEVLQVEITDDGIGLQPAHRAGVGLLSMRERAAELGGTCQIVPAPTGGTQVHARLPFLPG